MRNKRLLAFIKKIVQAVTGIFTTQLTTEKKKKKASHDAVNHKVLYEP
jgi:hypothetical protein